MKLEDFYKTSDEFDDLEDIRVLISEQVLSRCNINLTLESIWHSSSRKDWAYRIDPENPDVPLQRHVHIAKEKHKNSKNKQVSWNADGTRHDKNSFNDSVGKIKFVQQLARDVLAIPDNINLEHLNPSEESIIFSNVGFSEDSKTAFINISLNINS